MHNANIHKLEFFATCTFFIANLKQDFRIVDAVQVAGRHENDISKLFYSLLPSIWRNYNEWNEWVESFLRHAELILFSFWRVDTRNARHGTVLAILADVP